MLDEDDAANLLTTGFRILDGPFAGVVFCIVKIKPKVSEDKSHVVISLNFEVIQSHMPAEKLEHNKDFQRTVQLIATQLLEDDNFEVHNTNNPWLDDLQ